MAITEFTGKYACFSNYYMCPVEDDDMKFRNSEAVFQSLKYRKTKSRNIFKTMAPSTATLRGRQIRREKFRDDWEKVKDQMMLKAVKAKFWQNEYIRNILISTGDEEIINENDYHDNYWGNCTCEACKDIPGRNQLGKTLMEVREWVKVKEVKEAEKAKRRAERLARYEAEQAEKAKQIEKAKQEQETEQDKGE